MNIRCFTAAEVKLSCVMLGTLMLLWAANVGLDHEGRLYMMLDLWQARGLFALVMFISGALLVSGGICHARKIRHIGLMLTPFSTFPAYFLLLENSLAGVRALSLPFLGVMAVVLWVFDARGKPRNAQMDF